LHAEVLEDGIGEGELVAVEGALRLTDDHRVEPALGVAQRGQQSAGLRAALPGQRAAVGDVEVLGDDHAAFGLDELAGAGDLPVVGGLGVLLVLGGDPAVEGEHELLDQVVERPDTGRHDARRRPTAC